MTVRQTYWTCQVLGWSAYAAIGVLGASRQAPLRPTIIAGYALFALYSIALTDFFRREIRRRRWLDLQGPGLFARLAGGVFAVGLIQGFLIVAVDLALGRETSAFVKNPVNVVVISVGVTGVTSIWTILYVSMTATRRSREQGVRLQLALREAELRALEAQINPHFLFNCLNSIRGLVMEDPVLAQDMITRFANILRYNLHRDMEHTVPLSSEIEIVSDYLALESIRLEERLHVRIEIEPEAAQARIPPMLLQSLVENAVKHGIAPRPEGGELMVRARLSDRALQLEVVNPGVLVNGAGNGAGVGLANTRERLRILYGQRASLHLENRAGTVAATVEVPTHS